MKPLHEVGPSPEQGKTVKKRGLLKVNEHFEAVFNASMVDKTLRAEISK